MKKSHCFKVLIVVQMLFGCVSADDTVGVSDVQIARVLNGLDDSWTGDFQASVSYMSVQTLSRVRNEILPLLVSVIPAKCDLNACFRFGKTYVIEYKTRQHRLAHIQLGLLPDGKGVYCRHVVIGENKFLDIDRYVPELRYAPIVKDGSLGFVELWDSVSNGILRVPEGFCGRVQCGAGVFILCQISTQKYYLWEPANNRIEYWNYDLLNGPMHISFFLARSQATGNVCAFAPGLRLIPNSSGAKGIGLVGYYKGKQVFRIVTNDNKLQYFAMPGQDLPEALVNATETFSGCNVVVRGERILVIKNGKFHEIF